MAFKIPLDHTEPGAGELTYVRQPDSLSFMNMIIFIDRHAKEINIGV